MSSGVEIPHYSLIRRLDCSGATPLYLAEQAALERSAAVRVLNTAEASEAPELERDFVQVGQLLARINHPNVVRLYEIGETDALRFRAMEYIEGRSLHDMLQDGPAEPLQALEIVRQLAGALAAVHRAGQCLTELAPAVILFRDQRTPVLTDLALQTPASKAAPVEPGAAGPPATRYRSPEQARGGPPDVRSNVFMLGLLLFDLLGSAAGGVEAGDGPLSPERIDQRLRSLPEAWRELGPVLRRMLAEDPAGRYPDLDALGAELAALAPERTAVSSRPAAAAGAPRRRRAGLRWLGLLAALILLGGAFAAWRLSAPALDDRDLELLQRELAEFGRYMSRMDIYGPAGANATESLERLQAVTRSHPDVLAAAQQLAAIYRQDAYASFLRDDFEDALRLVGKGLDFLPDDPVLLQLRAEVTQAQRSARIEEMLQAAEAALRAGNRLPPRPGNAFGLLTEVKSLDPGNRRADTSLREIQLYVAEQARRAWREDGPAEAKRLASEGLALFPESPLLQDLLADLEQAERQADPVGRID